uniref:Transmembrane domain-containing protein n=1 Tax=Spironucleus salmonicida TaxID=348837 RepID=V6LTQ0_9EUKA|eukprot:EST47965.1 Transmembrane domain-containing protein [Spironucleus salmonicida]
MKQVTLYSQECQIIIIELSNILNISYNLLLPLFYCKISLCSNIPQMNHHIVQTVNFAYKVQRMFMLYVYILPYTNLQLINSFVIHTFCFSSYPQIFSHYIYTVLNGVIAYFTYIWCMYFFIPLLAHQIQLEVFSSCTSQCFYYYEFSLSYIAFCDTRFSISCYFSPCSPQPHQNIKQVNIYKNKQLDSNYFPAADASVCLSQNNDLIQKWVCFHHSTLDTKVFGVIHRYCLLQFLKKVVAYVQQLILELVAIIINQK